MRNRMRQGIEMSAATLRDGDARSRRKICVATRTRLKLERHSDGDDDDDDDDNDDDKSDDMTGDTTDEATRTRKERLEVAIVPALLRAAGLMVPEPSIRLLLNPFIGFETG